jgi:magnesium-transporting ATPase (P-type)
VVKVKENDFFPCDMVLINSSLPKGVCYVETKNLDGETNLKHKQANKSMMKMANSDDDVLMNFNSSQIDCRGPNELLYQFDGNITLQSGMQEPLNADNFLLRGSQLRNTDFIYGVATYTGHETKVMMNSTGSRAKKSDIEKKMDTYIIVIIVF